MSDTSPTSHKPLAVWLVLLAVGAALIHLPIREARLPLRAAAA